MTDEHACTWLGVVSAAVGISTVSIGFPPPLSTLCSVQIHSALHLGRLPAVSGLSRDRKYLDTIKRLFLVDVPVRYEPGTSLLSVPQYV